MEKINIAELLRNCPKGMKLYSPIFGDVYLDKIRPHLAIVVTTDKEQGDFKEEFLYDGRYGMNGKCMLFPSKGKTTWKGFVPPCKFRDGDVVATENGIFIGIVKVKNNESYETYCTINDVGSLSINTPYYFSRFATEEEKQKLFNAIKAYGYKWNAETKNLEKLIEPKFKVGDRVKHISDYKSGVVVKVSDEGYYIDYPKSEGICYISFELEKDYELTPDKFDINTLVPFESRVLVREDENFYWKSAIFGCYIKSMPLPYYVLGGTCWEQCVPYEGNEHLLGKTDDCDDFYKTW